MRQLYAQGDLLIERVSNAAFSQSTLVPPEADGAVVVAEGEASGHRHLFFDNVTMFRDDGLAREIPSSLYVGHVVVDAPGARLVHDEHSPINLEAGTYRIRRQRELEPQDVRLVSD